MHIQSSLVADKAAKLCTSPGLGRWRHHPRTGLNGEARSILTRANSARKRLISICSAVTFDRLSAPLSRPSRCAFTQLNNVWSTTPSVRDAAAIIWPDSTSRTASFLAWHARKTI